MQLRLSEVFELDKQSELRLVLEIATSYALFVGFIFFFKKKKTNHVKSYATSTWINSLNIDQRTKTTEGNKSHTGYYKIYHQVTNIIVAIKF